MREDVDQVDALDVDQLAEGLPHESTAELTPVPVTGQVQVSGRVPTVDTPADYGTYRTITLLGTEDKQQILPQDNHRTRAWIIVSGTGPVYVGSEGQCAAVRAGNLAGGGARLVAGGPALPVQHRQAVWLVPDQTNPAVVVVVQERNAT